MRRALAYAATFDALVVGHAEDPELVEGAGATEGEFATRLGLPAAPAIAEAMIVERDIRLVELTGARYHFGQISTRASAGGDRRRQGARACRSPAASPPIIWRSTNWTSAPTTPSAR